MDAGQEIQKMEGNKTYYNIYLGLLYCLTSIIIGVTGFINQQPIADILKFILLMVILITILFHVMKLYHIELFNKQANLIFFGCGFFISLIGVMLSTNYAVYNWWMIGSALIAVLIYPYFGLIFHLIFTFLFCAVNNPGMEYFAYYFIIGSIICVLANYIINTKTIGYVIMITLSIHVTLIFIIHNFNFTASMNLNAIISLVSTLTVIGLAYLIYRFSIPILETDKIKEKDEDEEGEEIIVNDKKESDEQLKLDVIMNGEYELIRRLSNYSKNLYIHSVDVGEMSARAARLIHANEDIARAGGLYHEIGRINGKNYIEEGVKIAVEQRFPDSVIQIIKQHNIKFEKPKSKEAAIVMLTDSVLSTMEYISSMPNKKNITPQELVESIFQIRLSKGTLEESGINVEEFKILKEFYIQNCF